MTLRPAPFAIALAGAVVLLIIVSAPTPAPVPAPQTLAKAPSVAGMTVYAAATHDRSPRLSALVSETGAAGSPGCAGRAGGCLGPDERDVAELG